MNTTINPALEAEIKNAIALFAEGATWSTFGADDKTDIFREIFEKDFDVSFKDVHQVYYYLQLPYDLHAVLEYEFMDIDLNFDVNAFLKVSKEKSSSKPKQDFNQNFNLYISESAPKNKKLGIDLGLRILSISWAQLFRAKPYGISDIKLSVRNAVLEDPNRLPLLLKIIEIVSNIPTLSTDEK
jgi:hypothetical protein